MHKTLLIKQGLGRIATFQDRAWSSIQTCHKINIYLLSRFKLMNYKLHINI